MARGVAIALPVLAALAALPSVAQVAPRDSGAPAPPANFTPPPLFSGPSLTLTPTTAPEDTSNIATLTADTSHYDRQAGRWTAAGSVVIRYRRYTLRADTLEYNENTQTALMAGTVSLEDGRNVVTGTAGSLLTFGLGTRTWTMTGATTDVKPEGAVSPIHISANILSGDTERLRLETVRMSTCDPDQLQYEVTARRMTLVPDERLTARHATIHLFGSRIVTVPSITLPIRRSEADRIPVVPSFGQSDVEGVFIKTNVNYALGDRNPGALRIDLMQRLGLGLGVRQDYGAPGGKGALSLYGTTGQANSLSSSLRHDQRIAGWTAAVTGEYRRKSEYFRPDTTSANAGLSLQRGTGPNASHLSLRWDESQGSYTYRNLSSTWDMSRQYTPRGNARVGLDYSKQSSAASSESLASRVEVRQGIGPVDLNVFVNHFEALSGAQNVYRPLQRLPELVLRSDAWRLGLTHTRALPLAFQFSSGHFKENAVSGDRQLLSLEAPSRGLTFGDVRFDVGGAFRQAVYSSEAMQYTLTGNARATVPIAKSSDFALAWSYQRPEGYTPFQFDRPFRYNTLLGSLKIASARGLEFRAGTGYDVNNSVTPWRDLLTYVRIEPNPRFRLINNVAFSLNGPPPGQDTIIRYVNTTLRLRTGKLRFDGDSRYFPQTGKFGRLLGNLSTPIGTTWTVRAILGSDSGQRYRRVLVVKDLGCLEAMVGAVDDRGWRKERGFRVMLRIKAFPFATDFESGMFGENLEVGSPDESFGGVSTGPVGLSPGL